MKEFLSFDDVLISPKFSIIKSRKDVNTESFGLRVPVISSNMDTVTGAKMVSAMVDSGGVGCLHRFCSIPDNVKMFVETDRKAWVSIGLGYTELSRAEALFASGADTFVIDVAHGASMEVVNQYLELCKIVGDHGVKIIVGNFATARSIQDFLYHSGVIKPNAFKIGIGGGSACLTRVVTGCGAPTLGSIIDCASVGIPIIADGGIRNSGDFSKALAAGASAVMIGRLFAGCDESPSELIEQVEFHDCTPGGCIEVKKKYKKYRGSASAESYVVQNKVSEWRTAEGDSYLIPHTGPVKDVMQKLEAGLRSAMSYVGAETVAEFKELADFIKITPAGMHENGAHGKNT